MGSYGRNFDFRVSPSGGQRSGRFMLSTSADVPIGAPVKYSSAVNTSAYGAGVQGVVLATGAQAPQNGTCGIAVYEYGPAGKAGFDPWLTNHSDMDVVPKGKLCQVVSGTEVKVVLKNTVDRTFLNTRDYDGRVMVAGVGGATSDDPAVGNKLTPGTGNDTDGYWAVNATASNAWLIVTAVDNSALEVEARMAF